MCAIHVGGGGGGGGGIVRLNRSLEFHKVMI